MEHVTYDTDETVAIVTLDRPDRANAVSGQTLTELDEAFTRAAGDEAVRVIVLRSNGKHFCAGHDIAVTNDELDGTNETPDNPITNTLASLYEFESKHYIGYSRAWRDIPKPTIAAVQGQCIAGGLMLCWPCDLIIAADNAQFSDPVVRMGIGGVEYHGHTWELGPRKAKEMLFTARKFSATEAESAGMVNRVVPLDELMDQTMELAHEISQMHPFALRQAKRAVNQTQDVQGFYSALQSVFDLHTVGHGNAISETGYPVIMNLDDMKKNN